MGKKIYLEIEINDDHDMAVVELQEAVEEIGGVIVTTRDITPVIEHVLKSSCVLFASRRDLGEVDEFTSQFTGPGEALVAKTGMFMAINTIADLISKQVEAEAVEG